MPSRHSCRQTFRTPYSKVALPYSADRARKLRVTLHTSRQPRRIGLVERSHEQEFYQLLDKDGITDDITFLNDKLREWEDYYYYHRPQEPLTGRPPTSGQESPGQNVTEVLRPYIESVGRSAQI